MERAAVKEVLRRLVGPGVRFEDSGVWVNLSCPLAEAYHAHRQDRHPSFGVTVGETTSVFYCFGCKQRGTLLRLVRLLEDIHGKSYGDVYREIEEYELLGPTLPPWEKTRTPANAITPLEPASVYLDTFESAAGHTYLKSRRISRKAVQRLHLKVDVDFRKVERILFPVFHADHRLYGFSGRAVTPALPKVRDYFSLPKRKLLLGSQLIQPEDEYVILVEGLFDCARLVQYDYPAVAAMGSELSQEQATTLIQWGRPVYVLFDNDVAGYRGRERVFYRLHPHVPVLNVTLPEGVKDPDELYPEEVDVLLKAAELM